jgi:beta-glucosidase
VGPLANDTLTSMSRYGPSNTKVTSVLEGIKNYCQLQENIKINYTKGCESTVDKWHDSELFPSISTLKDQQSIDTAISMAKSADVIIAVMVETENQFGESRSRTNLDLTGRQLQLLQSLFETGKPIVLILINGQPLTINWPAKFVPAILEAWCPGQDGGNAIAEAIFGDYNPGGKLPVTFPKSVGQIELNFPFKPGSHAGQPGDGPNGFGKTNVIGALYPFGFGLSYTTFEYSNLKFDHEKLTTSQPLKVYCDIKNTGKFRGDEVVQLYIKDEVSSVTVYESQLRGFERITLEPGKQKQVTFILEPEAFSLLDKDLKRIIEKGDFQIMIGSSSEDIRLRKKITF